MKNKKIETINSEGKGETISGYNHRQSCPTDKKQAKLWKERANANELDLLMGNKPTYEVNDYKNEGREM